MTRCCAIDKPDDTQAPTTGSHDAEAVRALHRDFALAEKIVRAVENIDDELPIPAINELRYLGYHLLEALKDGDSESYKRARRHGQRAIYDAAEAGLIFCVRTLEIFAEDYRRQPIVQVLPEYLDILALADRVRDHMADLETRRDDRYRYAEEAYDLFQEFLPSIKKLSRARGELNKFIKQDRQKAFLAALGVVVAFLGLVSRLSCGG